MQRIVEVNSLEETRALAQELAPTWDIGTVVRLEGGLGAGKTTFTQFIAETLGVNQFVGSPTFKLISEYKGRDRMLYHVDCYRIQSPKDFLEIGGELYLYPEDGITLIEWANNITSIIPESAVMIEITRNPTQPSFRQFRIQTG